MFAVPGSAHKDRKEKILVRLGSLRHLAEVVRSMARPEKLVVMGSTSLFASFPELDTDDGPLAGTYDANLKARLDATPQREAMAVTSYRCFHEVVAQAGTI